jgi:hypothetical protein
MNPPNAPLPTTPNRAGPVAVVEHLAEGALEVDGLRRHAQDIVLDAARSRS